MRNCVEEPNFHFELQSEKLTHHQHNTISTVTMLGFLTSRLRGLNWTVVQTVKIHVVTSGQTFGAHHDLLNQLERKLKLCQTDRDRNAITMLFCPITSRVGSDVEAAMSLLSGDQKVILVLMHHTRDPSYSTAGRDWKDVYPNVVSSVHVLFHETVPGLLTCSENDMAVDQMLRVLSSYSSWKISRMFWVKVTITSVALICTYYMFFNGKRRTILPPSTENMNLNSY
ncbi:uncharacterized protein LOC129379144 isoform X2 [Poeciliopsis prolifica]|uniref:uncharacterized protein LOC129379144 isoform X2 n=2 Tax=Poeciliopsis prolifica TaxID=188132 RepID=UPI0024142083|nr:uncharacterized protein LOC129379144 isoform X2 [Poeciliopsis prolifica]